jgi:transcriptional regulator with XRE-family HTH domain
MSPSTCQPSDQIFRDAREACGLTREALSRATGIPLGRIERIESGRAAPSALEFAAWLWVCDQNWEALPDDDPDKRFDRLVRTMSPAKSEEERSASSTPRTRSLLMQRVRLRSAVRTEQSSEDADHSQDTSLRPS